MNEIKVQPHNKMLYTLVSSHLFEKLNRDMPNTII